MRNMVTNDEAYDLDSEETSSSEMCRKEPDFKDHKRYDRKRSNWGKRRITN
jgi:hypothetical protein